MLSRVSIDGMNGSDESTDPTRKEQCKQIMLELFGPSNAAKVDYMDESECVEECREKVRTLLGEAFAKKFDDLE